MFYAENKSHIPNSPLREDIVRKVNRYIGYVYADDFHSGDYITVNEVTLEVGFWSRHRADEQRLQNCKYYDLFSLIRQGNSSFTFEPDEVGIDIAVLDFFPIEKVCDFVSKATTAIKEFHLNEGYDKNAVLGIAYSPLAIQVFNPANLEEATDEDYEMMIDELGDCSLVDEFDLKDFVRPRNNGDIYINEEKLKRLALEKFDDI